MQMEDCFFDIHCVLVTQVNDQKIQWQLTASVFFSYKPLLRYFSHLLIILGSIESQKSNCHANVVHVKYNQKKIINPRLRRVYWIRILKDNFCLKKS